MHYTTNIMALHDVTLKKANKGTMKPFILTLHEASILVWSWILWFHYLQEGLKMPILDTDETHEIVASWEIVRQDPVENGLKFFQ